MSNVSEELLQEWKRAGYHSNGKPGKSAFGEGGIALSQLDGPFERDFHAMRKRLGELEDQLTKSRLVNLDSACPASGIALEGEIDSRNKHFKVPENLTGRYLVFCSGQILRESLDYQVEGDFIVLCSSPDYEIQRPRIYFVK